MGLYLGSVYSCVDCQICAVFSRHSADGLQFKSFDTATLEIVWRILNSYKNNFTYKKKPQKYIFVVSFYLASSNEMKEVKAKGLDVPSFYYSPNICLNVYVTVV
jgi:hypothetical protein